VISLASSLLAALVVAAAGGAVATVDGVAIPATALLDAMASSPPGARAPAPAEALDALIDQALLAAEGRRLKLAAEMNVRVSIETAQRKLLGAAFVEREVAAGINVPEEELRALFHARADVAKAQLLKYATREEAAAARGRLDKGGDVAAEAGIGSTPGGAAAKPVEVVRGELDPVLADAVFGGALGAWAGPLALKLGFALARPVERRVGDEAGYQAARPSLLAFTKKRQADQARDHLAKQNRAKAGAVLDEKFIAGLEQRVIGTPAEMKHVIATVNGRPLPYEEIVPGLLAFLGGGQGHMSGPTIKISVAWQEIDARILADMARAKGLDRDPAVAEALAGAERRILAAAAADRLRGSATGPDGEKVLRKALTGLRSKAAVSIDEAALAQALERRR
jgi:hypothetical protein